MINRKCITIIRPCHKKGHDVIDNMIEGPPIHFFERSSS
jgi:hypothetical protein